MPDPAKPKRPSTSFNLNAATTAALADLTERYGLDRTSAVEAGVRMLAETMASARRADAERAIAEAKRSAAERAAQDGRKTRKKPDPAP